MPTVIRPPARGETRRRGSPAPLALLGAVLAAGALTWLAPFASTDADLAGAIHDRVHAAPRASVVAVVVEDGDPATAAAVEARARTAGARRILGPEPGAGRGPAGARGVAELSGRALLDGRAPAEGLAGRIVVIDAPGRAQARAAVQARLLQPRMQPAERGGLAAYAVLVATIVGFAALGYRAPAAAGIAGLAVALSGALVAIAAARGVAVPAIELLLAVPLASIGAALDTGRALRRALLEVAAPLLRATADRGGGVADDTAEGLVGPPLAELLGARALLLFEAPPGARAARVIAGWRLRPGDVPADAPLALDRPPWRDAAGVPRPTEVTSLLPDDTAATLLPLTARGELEGYLLVVADVPSALERHAAATRAACEGLAGAMRALRQRRTPLPAVAPIARATAHAARIAAEALEEEGGLLASAASSARTGLGVLTAAGVTRWKNARFDEALAALPPAPGGELGRVLALAGRPDETPLATLERLLAGSGAVRTAFPDRALLATITPLRPAGGAPGLLVELEVLDAAAAGALLAAPGVALHASTIEARTVAGVGLAPRATTLEPAAAATSVPGRR